MTAASGPLSLACPAKLNLFLEVRKKMPDGYHELGTLFQALDFGDTLQAEFSEGIEVVCDAGITGKPEENLVYRAATLLRSRYADKVAGRGIRFLLEKRIPMGAGLGGGSSDAASALQLANVVWGLGLTLEELRQLAPELGSDVAFFLYPSTAYAEGRGEKLSPAPTPYPFHVVVATPPCHVETAWAYRQIAPQVGRWETFKTNYPLKASDPDFYRALHNDFELPVSAEFPEIQRIREILGSCQPIKAMLTGSGASVFALFREAEEARACLAKVAPFCRFSTQARFRDPPRIC